MRLNQLLAGVEYTTALGDIEIKGISTNSRQMQQGDLFVCIKGEKSDGHNYADDAIRQGAAAILTERDLGFANQIVVPSTRVAYGLACANYFGNPAKKLKLIGVTGTNGKTTVSSLVKYVLTATGHKAGLIGTIHNEIGDMVIPAKYTTPDPFILQSMLARMVEAGCEYVAMEVSSHGLDQHRLEGCRFDTGIFTNLTQDHLDYHKTMENYYQAKKKLFDISERAVINIDDSTGRRLLSEVSCPVTTFSVEDDTADYTAHSITPSAKGSSFALVGKGVIARVKLQMPGAFSVSNAMAAAVTCLGLGLPLEDIAKALSDCPGVVGRAEVIASQDGFTVIRDYAHTPDGLEKIITALREFATGRVVTLFGCAGNRDATKRPKMAAAAARLSDFCILTSDNPRSEDADKIIADALPGFEGYNTPYITITDRYEAIKWALENIQQNDILLLAGKGHEDYQVLKDETIYFDEKVLVTQLLAERQK